MNTNSLKINYAIVTSEFFGPTGNQLSKTGHFHQIGFRQTYSLFLSLLLLTVPMGIVGANDATKDGPAVITRIRFHPEPGDKQELVGGIFSGSNTVGTEGYTPLVEIQTVPPANEWSELSFENKSPYRYLRYVAPHGSSGLPTEIEFWNDQKMVSSLNYNPATKSIDIHGKGKVCYQETGRLNWFVYLDLEEAGTCKKPEIVPMGKVCSGPIQVTMTSSTPNSTIRYTLDGTVPSDSNGLTYSAPITVDHVTTIQAVTTAEGIGPSPVAQSIYMFNPVTQPELYTLHVGNSLTRSTLDFSKYASTLNYRHNYLSFLHMGGLTVQLWNDATLEKSNDSPGHQGKSEWEKDLGAFSRLDDFTLQPRDFNMSEEVENDLNFIRLVRTKFPDVQTWLYAEWVENNRNRPTDLGQVPSAEMSKTYPALTWEESMSAMLLYVEDLERMIKEKDPTNPAPRIIPSNLAMGWIHHMIDRGQFPGMKPGSFYPNLFGDGFGFDNVHPARAGRYLVDLTWFSAFYKKPPTGMLPINTTLSAEQAEAMQRLAWDVIKNYPDCGLYEEGSSPTANPEFSHASNPVLDFIPFPSKPIPDVQPITLQSATPGAWFRYTLDGTVPTRTRGYVYCGVISYRPGMTLKAIAYKSGMADSAVSEMPQ